MVHFQEFGSYKGTWWPRNVSYMVKAQVVKYHNVPIITFKLTVNVPGDIVINLLTIVINIKVKLPWMD